jgi:hypothetical protein
MPMADVFSADAYVAHDLFAWYELTPYKRPSDYVWATDANRAGAKRGKQPVWLSAVMRDYIQPAARKLGISKRCNGGGIAENGSFSERRSAGRANSRIALGMETVFSVQAIGCLPLRI